MQALTPLLLDAALKATAILIVAAIAAAAMRRSSAAARHLVWTMAVAGVLALPAMSVLLPGLAILPASPLAGLDDERLHTASDHAADHAEPSPGVAPLSDVGQASDNAASPGGWSDPRREDAPDAMPPAPAAQSSSDPVDDLRAAADAAPAPASPATATSTEHRSTWTATLPWLPWIWLGGASFALLPIILGAIALARLKRHSQPITTGSWQSLLTRCRQQISLTRRVTLRRSNRPIMPMTWGGFPVLGRATILLPPESDAWPADRRRAVLLHELAHVKRRDCLTQTLTQLACALYWFNPLIWLAGQRMLVERERACDDMVLLNETKASDYAEHLLEIATGPQANFFAAHAGIAMARASKLDGRLVAILDQHRNRRAMSRVGVALTVALLGAVVVPVAMLQGELTPDRAAPDDPVDAPRNSDGAAVAVLPDGVQVELVGLSLHPSANETWWSPSGRPLESAPAQEARTLLRSTTHRPLERVVRVRGLNGRTLDITGDGGGMSTGSEDEEGYYWHNRFLGDPDRDATHMRLRLAYGPWRTVARAGVDGDEGFSGAAGTFAFAHPVQRADGALVRTVTHDVHDHAYRLVAFDHEGEMHMAAARGQSVGLPGLFQTTGVFADLDLDQVQRFELQIRPYHEIEFRNVSLRPGHETQVEVVIEPGEPDDEAGTAGRAGGEEDLPTEPLRRALALLEHLEGGRFNEAREHFDDRMRQMLPVDELERMWTQLDDLGGAYRGRGEAYHRRENGYDAIYVPLRWQRNAIELKAVFDANANVAGLWTLPPGVDARLMRHLHELQEARGRLLDRGMTENHPRVRALDAQIREVQQRLGETHPGPDDARDDDASANEHIEPDAPAPSARPDESTWTLTIDVEGERMRLRSPSVTVVVGDGYVEVTDEFRQSRQARFQAARLHAGVQYRYTANEGRIILDSPTGPATIHLREGRLHLRSEQAEITAERVRLRPHDGRWRVLEDDPAAVHQLGPGDVISVQIFELFQPGRDHVESRQIDAAGEIRLPRLGVVEAAGRTRDELEEHIAGRLREAGLLRRPSVRVRIWQRYAGEAPFEDPVIKPGQRLQLRIYELERPGQDWGGRIEVDDQGRIGIPELGAVELAGLTTAEAEDHLRQRLAEAEMRRNPIVRIAPESIQRAQRLSALPRRIEFLEGQLRRIEARLEAGRAGVDEVTDAQAQLAEARIELARLLNDHHQALQQLEQLIAMQQQRVDRQRRLMDAGRATANDVAEAQLQLNELELRLERRRQELPANDNADNDAPAGRHHPPDVRVLAIGRDPHGENRWHLPDGTPLAEPPAREPIRYVRPPGDKPAQVVAVLLSHRPRHHGDYALAYEFDLPYRLTPERLDVPLKPGLDDVHRGRVYLFADDDLPEALTIHASIADLSQAEQLAHWDVQTGQVQPGRLNASFHDLRVRAEEPAGHLLRFRIEHDMIDQDTQYLSAVLHLADGHAIRRPVQVRRSLLGEGRAWSSVVVLLPAEFGPELREVHLELSPHSPVSQSGSPWTHWSVWASLQQSLLLTTTELVVSWSGQMSVNTSSFSKVPPQQSPGPAPHEPNRNGPGSSSSQRSSHTTLISHSPVSQ